MAYNGMVVSPHHLASQAGWSILREGGNAVEAIIATAAALGVVYPHMTGIGGDGFWLILPGENNSIAPALAPVAIDASGRSARLASCEWYEALGCTELPKRGPAAAMTMAGAVSGWQMALETASAWSRQGLCEQPLPLGTILSDACRLAEEGYPVTHGQSSMTRNSLHELASQPGFSRQFLLSGQAPETGSRLRLPAQARTLRTLATEGLDSFYHGTLAKDMAADLEEAGSPLRPDDFTNHQAHIRPALSIRLHSGMVYNTPPPTQGLASLLILALTERFIRDSGRDISDDLHLVHAIVEATKQAFLLRDKHIADPDRMRAIPEALLSPKTIKELATAINPVTAAPWPQARPGGDTVWLGAADSQGNMVSYIQSIYHEFGSGLVLPKTGVLWNNRGLGFAHGTPAANKHPNCLAPAKRPFHTLNPAMALLDDGRKMAYGTMGGEGQPQTQAAVFFRHLFLGMSLQEAIAAPRWLLGRAWGDASTSLKLEQGFRPGLGDELRSMGHIVEETPALNSLMGHAGAVVRHPHGLLEGAADPRSDGSAAGW